MRPARRRLDASAREYVRRLRARVSLPEAARLLCTAHSTVDAIVADDPIVERTVDRLEHRIAELLTEEERAAERLATTLSHSLGLRRAASEAGCSYPQAVAIARWVASLDEPSRASLVEALSCLLAAPRAAGGVR